MRNLKYLFIAFVFIATACENKKNSERIIGTWEIVKANGSLDDLNIGTQYLFEKESLTFSKDGFDNKAKSEITDSTFTWDNGSMKMDYTYSFEGSNLIVKLKGSDQEFVLEKK
ncbi:MAG: hypothetical protein PHC28_02370 [Flavobacterium sp.]|uniref:lipocalin family protein n=1 Tax=Flavobacterium sp. TaxID=239 RepID=UPI00263A2D0C|nr:lipocalin family protein [Flavobacterium sp.]MDD5149311.1 hypothetical protein [Flavobacterium sp.]